MDISKINGNNIEGVLSILSFPIMGLVCVVVIIILERQK